MELTVDRDDLLNRIKTTLEKHTSELEAPQASPRDRVLEVLRQTTAAVEAGTVPMKNAGEYEDDDGVTKAIVGCIDRHFYVEDHTKDLKLAIAMYSAHVGKDVTLSRAEFEFLFEGKLGKWHDYWLDSERRRCGR